MKRRIAVSQGGTGDSALGELPEGAGVRIVIECICRQIVIQSSAYVAFSRTRDGVLRDIVRQNAAFLWISRILPDGWVHLIERSENTLVTIT